MKTSSTASMLLSLPLLATSAAAAFLNFPSSGPSEPRWLTKDAAPIASSERRATNSSAWPHGPLDTKGRDIINSRGDVVNWAGINWPMSGETMIPEGLEWASVDEILDHVAEVGWNWLRMGYAIEMVDEIYLRDGADVPLEVAMIQALGYVNGTKVTNEVIAKNPSWTRQTGRFEIWSDIAKAAEKRGIFIHPDVHVGKAQWCCSHTDGNSWFDDLNFPVANWLRGLKYVATWALDHPNVASMSLRNELRESWNVTNLYYNWHTLVGNMTAGSDAIHEANPDMLITWSGMQYDQDLSALTTGKNLFTAPCYKCTAIRDAATREPEYFNLADHPWGSKIVWELHLYTGSEDINTDNCEVVEAELYRSGFHALGMDAPSGCDIIGDCPKPKQLTPVMLSEFGHAQDETIYNATLQNCLKDYTQKHNISWAVWSLAGSYRIRSGVQGMADTWGLSSFDWQGWNYAAGIDGYWKPWIQATNPTKLD